MNSFYIFNDGGFYSKMKIYLTLIFSMKDSPIAQKLSQKTHIYLLFSLIEYFVLLQAGIKRYILK